MSELKYDAIVIGAGAAGLMAAITAGRRGLRVLVVDHANKIGKKILMSGGGRCNFTNTGTTPANYLSANPHFCKSALARYTPWHFIELVERHGIAYHEELADSGLPHDADAIRAQTRQHIAAMQQQADAVFNNFLDLVGRPQRRYTLPSREWA